MHQNKSRNSHQPRLPNRSPPALKPHQQSRLRKSLVLRKLARRRKLQNLLRKPRLQSQQQNQRERQNSQRLKRVSRLIHRRLSQPRNSPLPPSLQNQIHLLRSRPTMKPLRWRQQMENLLLRNQKKRRLSPRSLKGIQRQRLPPRLPLKSPRQKQLSNLLLIQTSQQKLL
jgi:hypothetical protein